MNKPGLYLLETSSEGASHDAPKIHGPYEDDAARVRDAAKRYLDFFYDGDLEAAIADDFDFNEYGESSSDLYLWRLDWDEAGVRVGACCSYQETTAVLEAASASTPDGKPVTP